MELDLDQPGSGYSVRRVEADAVVVGSARIEASFLLAPDALVRDWPATAIGDIDAAHVEAILKLAPEVVLVGTGARQAFLDPALQARFLERGIGVECMDNHACARTYNLLAGEARRVVAAFVLPNGG